MVHLREDGSEKTTVEVVVQSNMALLTTLTRGNRYKFEVAVQTAADEEDFDARSLKPPQKVFATSIYKNGFQAYWIADSLAIVSSNLFSSLLSVKHISILSLL